MRVAGSYVYSVPLRVRREELLAAAQAWDEDNSPFPEREVFDTSQSRRDYPGTTTGRPPRGRPVRSALA
jgi:hypothetical protein